MAGKKAVNKGIKATYICNVPVRHDGEKYAKGEEVDLFTSEAEHLLAAGSISPKLVPAGKAATSTAATSTSTSTANNDQNPNA